MWLYRASPLYFPRGWRFFRVAVEEALSGVNIVRQYHKWWLLGSAPGNGLGASCCACCLCLLGSVLGCCVGVPRRAGCGCGRQAAAGATIEAGTASSSSSSSRAHAGKPSLSAACPPRPAPRPADGQDHVLRLFASKSPLGPWEPHLGGTLAAEGALTMGKVFTYKNSLHRLGRSCRAGVCGPVEVHQVRPAGGLWMGKRAVGGSVIAVN